MIRFGQELIHESAVREVACDNSMCATFINGSIRLAHKEVNEPLYNKLRKLNVTNPKDTICSIRVSRLHSDRLPEIPDAWPARCHPEKITCYNKVCYIRYAYASICRRDVMVSRDYLGRD